MSVALAAIGNNIGIVASDSISCSPEGEVSYNCNKTFRLKRFPVIGAYVGRLEFSEKGIPDHLDEILGVSKHKSMLSVVESIKVGMSERLSRSGASDCKVEIILLGRKNLEKDGILQIYTLEFKHTYDPNTTDQFKLDSFAGKGACAHTGDGKARELIESYFQKNSSALQADNLSLLKLKIKNIMETAIIGCGDCSDFPDLRACGLPVSVRLLEEQKKHH